MSDEGWVRDPDDTRWVLLDQHGEEIEDVPDRLLAVAGHDVIHRTLLFDGLPPLPEIPAVVCKLERGPQDGRWWYLPCWPGRPPEGLSFARSQPARAKAAGVRVTGLVNGFDRYVLTGQPGGDHRPGRPYTYRWEPGP